MLSKTLLLLLHLTASRSFFEPPKTPTQILEYSRRISSTCTFCRTALLIVSTDCNLCDVLAKDLNQKPNFDLLTIKVDNFSAEYDENYDFKPDLSIVFLNEGFKSIEGLIFALEFAPFWNIRSKFLIIADEIGADEEWVKEGFGMLWEKQVLRAIIGVLEEGRLRTYSYDPFLGEFFREITGDVGFPKLFAEGVTDMHGHPLKFYLFDIVVRNEAVEVKRGGKSSYIGFGGKYWNAFADALNATLMVHRLSEDFDEQTINSANTNLPFAQFVNLFKDLFDFDAIMNSMKIYSDNGLDKVFLYERNDIFICIPSGEVIPPYLYIFLILPGSVWVAIIISIGLVTLGMVVVRKFSKLEVDFVKIFYDNIRLLLNSSAPFYERNNKEKLLYLLWMFHCLIIITVFQSTLMTTLVVPKYYPNIQSLRELYKTDIEVYGSNYTVHQIIRELDGEDRQLMKHLKSVPKNVTAVGENLEWITNYRNSGVLISKVQVYELKRVDKNTKRSTYHIIKESPLPVALAFVIRPDKFYFNEMMQTFGRIHDAGLNIYWRNFGYDLDLKDETYGTKILDDFSTDDDILKLEHFQSAFMLLIFGNVVASLIFVLEICISKWKK